MSRASSFQVFIVDNSGSMLQYKDDARKVLEAAFYSVKRYDPDGVDLLFTQGTRKSERIKKTKEALKSFDKVEWQGHTNMETRLGEEIDRYRNYLDSHQPSTRISGWLQKTNASRKGNPPRRLSLYILSDAIWEPGTDLVTPISELVKTLKSKSLVNRQVGIQFIYFGGDEGAKAYLEALDNNLGKKLNMYVQHLVAILF